MFPRWSIVAFVIVSLSKAQIPDITSGAYNIPTHKNSAIGLYDKLTPVQIRSAENENENDREKLSPLNEPNVDDNFKEVLNSSDSSQSTTSVEDFHQAKVRSSDFKQNSEQLDYLVSAANPTGGHDQYKNKLDNVMKNIGKEVSGAVKKIEKALWSSHTKTEPKESSGDFENGDKFTPYKVWVDGGEIKADEKIKNNINSVGGLMKKYLTVINDKNAANVDYSMPSKFSPGLKQTMDDFQKSLSGFSLLNKQNAPQVSSSHENSDLYPTSLSKNSQSEKANPLVKLTSSASKPSGNSKTDPSVNDKKIPEKENSMKDIWSKASDLTSKIVDTVNSAKDQVNKYVDGTQASKEPEFHKTYYPYDNFQNYLGQQQTINPPVHDASAISKAAQDLYQSIASQNKNGQLDGSAIWNAGNKLYQAIAEQNPNNGYPSNNPLEISNAAQKLYHSITDQNQNGQVDPLAIWNAGNNLYQAISGQNQNNGYPPNNPLEISNAAQKLYHSITDQNQNGQVDPLATWNAGNHLYQTTAGKNQYSNGQPDAFAIFNAGNNLYQTITENNQNNGQPNPLAIWNAGNNLYQAIKGQNQNNGYPPNNPLEISNAAQNLYQNVAGQYTGSRFYKREVANETSIHTKDDSIAEQADSTRTQRQIFPPLIMGAPRLPVVPMVAPIPGTISRAALHPFGIAQPKNVVNEAVSLASGILAKDPTKIAQSGVGLGGSIATSTQANGRILRHIDCKFPVVSINLPEKIVKVSQDPRTVQTYNTLGSPSATCPAANDLSGNIKGNVMITQPNYEAYEPPAYTNPDITSSAIDSSTDPALQKNNPHDQIHNSAIELAHGIVDSLNLDKPSGEFAKSNIKMASQIVSMAINPQNAGNLPTVDSTDPYAARWKPITDMTSRIVALAAQGNNPSAQSYTPQYYYISPDHGFISPMFGKIWNSGVKLGSDIKAAPAVLDSVASSKLN